MAAWPAAMAIVTGTRVVVGVTAEVKGASRTGLAPAKSATGVALDASGTAVVA